MLSIVLLKGSFFFFFSSFSFFVRHASRREFLSLTSPSPPRLRRGCSFLFPYYSYNRPFCAQKKKRAHFLISCARLYCAKILYANIPGGKECSGKSTSESCKHIQFLLPFVFIAIILPRRRAFVNRIGQIPDSTYC